MQLWLCDDGLQAGRSSLLQRRLESDAEVVVARQLQAGRSSLPQRRLESDAELVVATPAAGWPFFFAAAKIRIGCGRRCRYASCRRAILLCCYENWKRTRKTVETTNSAGETLHRFSSLGLKSRITARWMAFQSKTLH